MSDGSLCGDIRERGNIIDQNRCSSSWNREKFQKRNRNEFDNRNNNYGNQSRDNQYQQRDCQRDNRQFDKAPGGSNRKVLFEFYFLHKVERAFRWSEFRMGSIETTIGTHPTLLLT